jgi:hypothetical protein
MMPKDCIHTRKYIKRQQLIPVQYTPEWNSPRVTEGPSQPVGVQLQIQIAHVSVTQKIVFPSGLVHVCFPPLQILVYQETPG